MLGDVNVQVSDGQLGFGKIKGSGVFAVIGVSSKKESPIIINSGMSAVKIKEMLGLSPLADSVMDSVENGAYRIYCFPVTASSFGTISEIEKIKQGGGNITVAGKPENDYRVIIKISGKGTLNSALFSYSLDNGLNFSDELTIPINGEYEIPDTGLTITFNEISGEEKENSFQVGDTYKFLTTAPKMQQADVLKAIEAVKQLKQTYGFVHIVGEAGNEMWAAVSEAQQELEKQHHKPLLFVLEAYAPGENEEVKEYVDRLLADRKKIKNRNIQVVAARSVYLKMDGRIKEQNNAGIVCGLYAKTEVHQSIGRTRAAYGMGISAEKMLDLTPVGIREHIETLDEAGYLTFRNYEGLDNYYVSNARVMSSENSDYHYAEDVRVLNKIMQEVRKAALPLLQEDIDSSDIPKELERMAKFMEVPLDKMIEDREISAAEITIPEDQNIAVNETMKVTIRYQARGYIRNIEVDIGRTSS